MSRLKVVMFGTPGVYSAAFSRALAPRCELVRCLVRRPVEGMIGEWFRHRRVPHDALGFACPVESVGAYDESPLYERMRDVDLIVSAGFPRKLPAALANAAARYGAFNVHPGLLPNDRGPLPLYWALRRGDPETGVSVHRLSDTFDAGALVGSARLPVPFGVDGRELFEAMGRLAGESFAEVLERLRSGTLAEVAQPTESPTPWARKPAFADREIVPSEWTCRALYHFVRGTRFITTPWVNLHDDVRYVDAATGLNEGEKVPGEFVLIERRLVLAVRDGSVSLRLCE